MLPSEVLFTVFKCLPREDWDTLLLVNVKCSDTVATDSVDAPLRAIQQLQIRKQNPHSFAFVCDYSSRPVKLDVKNAVSYTPELKPTLFSRRNLTELRHLLCTAVVHELRLFDALDDALVSALLPVRHSWINAVCFVEDSGRFSTPSVFSGRVVELLACQTLIARIWLLNSTDLFKELPSVQRLALSECGRDSRFRPTVLSAWLHRKPEQNDDGKCLELHEDHVSLRQLVPILKNAFTEAREPRCYTVKIVLAWENYADLECALLNATTSETFRTKSHCHFDTGSYTLFSIERNSS